MRSCLNCAVIPSSTRPSSLHLADTYSPQFSDFHAMHPSPELLKYKVEVRLNREARAFIRGVK
ncbi:unnamed protein product [Penicillium roqueforti FM164]|uniref:Genomic scaffold, ProqFM164S02 n=1 Tax=Penicillium roqueforti (strain FM164) TaxID=1365484 RepID=W6QLB2_PENRF|nr:unnamed protein product [Penicillium roqueforti FM164]